MANRPRDVGASVRARLLDRARAEPTDFQELLMRYALERLLYRLSVSPYRERFVGTPAAEFMWLPRGPWRNASQTQHEERELKRAALRQALKEGEDSGKADDSLQGLLDELDRDP